MSDLFLITLRLHIACAILCGLLFWGPLLSREGGRVHRGTGRAFLATLVLTTLTAVLLTLFTFVDPDGARPEQTGMPLDPMIAEPGLYTLYRLFLAWVALLTLAAGLFGMAALRRPIRGRGTWIGAHALLLLLGLLLVGFALPHGALPVITVGLAGALLSVFNLSRLRGDPGPPVSEHATAMLFSGIGLYSTVAVVVANRMVPEFFHSTAGLIVWLLPTLIGLPAILLLRRRLAAR